VSGGIIKPTPAPNYERWIDIRPSSENGFNLVCNAPASSCGIDVEHGFLKNELRAESYDFEVNHRKFKRCLNSKTKILYKVRYYWERCETQGLYSSMSFLLMLGINERNKNKTKSKQQM
jgi:hypothetical protein